MFNVIVEIKAPEITEAIWALIGSLTNAKINGAPVQTQSIIPPVPQIQQEQPQQIPMQQAPQVQTYGQPQQIQPEQQVQPQPQQTQPSTAVPTAAQTYTLDQLAVAATQLMDAGRRTELLTLLSTFGVQALTMLPKEQYGNFATQLRSLGVRI